MEKLLLAAVAVLALAGSAHAEDRPRGAGWPANKQRLRRHFSKRMVLTAKGHRQEFLLSDFGRRLIWPRLNVAICQIRSFDDVGFISESPSKAGIGRLGTSVFVEKFFEKSTRPLELRKPAIGNFASGALGWRRGS